MEFLPQRQNCKQSSIVLAVLCAMNSVLSRFNLTEGGPWSSAHPQPTELKAVRLVVRLFFFLFIL